MERATTSMTTILIDLVLLFLLFLYCDEENYLKRAKVIFVNVNKKLNK